MRRTLNDENDTGDYYKVGMKNIKEKAFADRVKEMQQDTQWTLAYKTRQNVETTRREETKQVLQKENMLKKFKELENTNSLKIEK